MPFHIRHGAPGSYKSACAVHIDVLTWLKQGREVHTNIRGIGDVADFETAYKITLPDTAKVVAYDIRTRSDKMMFAAWFHWLPLGAAIVIDEGQMIYPDRKDFKATDLDLPDDENPVNPETGERERPSDIFQAIDMHRHYNWDGCVTTPNIRKLPTWFRGSVERAYKHENRSHIPLQKGKTRIISHGPETLSPTISKGVPVETIKVPKHVFECYGSTTTGAVTDNIAKKNPLRTPAVYLPLGIAVAGILWTLSGLFGIMGGEDGAEPDSPLQVAPAPGTAPRGPAPDYRVPVQDDPVEPVVMAGRSMFDRLSSMLPGAQGVTVAGWFGSGDTVRYMYRVVTGDQDYVVWGDWFADAGFDMTVVDPCRHDLSHPSISAPLRVVCAPVSRETSEAERASGTQGADNLGGSLSILPGVS